MTDDFKTFDLAEVLAGKKNPRDTVEVWFNDELGYAISNLVDLLGKLPANHPDREKLENELDALKEAGKDQRFVIHLKGSDRADREKIMEEVTEIYPVEVDPLFGRPKNNAKANRLHAEKYWLLHIEKIEAPGGAVYVPDEVGIKLLRGRIPDAAIDAIEAGMDKLVTRTTDGFDRLKTDLSFFAEPSPEG